MPIWMPGGGFSGKVNPSAVLVESKWQLVCGIKLLGTIGISLDSFCAFLTV